MPVFRFVCFILIVTLLCLSPGSYSWVEVILPEIHDFSRAVDGLVKEIYLGIIFLQLQVRTVVAAGN